MIIERKAGNILKSPERHVVFAVNSEGYNDVGLPGAVARNFWPELASRKPIDLGRILTKDTGKKVFHALVVYSLQEGWNDAPGHIEACFNELEVATDQEIASVAIGNDAVGVRTGADPQENLAAIDRSHKYVVVYDPPLQTSSS